MSEQTVKAVRAPLCHVVARSDVSVARQIAVRMAAIALALVTGAVLLLILGQNPLAIYGTMVSGSLGSKSSLFETIKVAIPLCISALGVTLAFRMRFWNIGAEGQICVGAMAASFFAYTFGGVWPSWALILAMALAAILMGGLWGMIPAWCKTKWGTNETLFTLMMNYVALYFIQFLREGPWRDASAMGFPITPRFDKAARLPKVMGIHAGWIVALVLVVALTLYVRRTKQGYELTAVGENSVTARYAGMPVKRIVLRTMFLSAAICALAGMIQVSGADMQLTDSVAGGVGFTAIIVAWLARLSPLGILVASFLFGMMEKGSSAIEAAFKLSPAMADVLQGIILFFVLGAEFFINYKLMFRGQVSKGGAGK